MESLKNIIIILISIGLIFISFSYSKLVEKSTHEYARLSSITYQSLNKLDSKILDEYLLLEKDGLTAEEVAIINSKILNK